MSTISSDAGPKFVNNPEPIVAPLGDEVEFECSLDIKADQIRWKHNGRLLPAVFNETTKSQLIFKVCYLIMNTLYETQLYLKPIMLFSESKI